MEWLEVVYLVCFFLGLGFAVITGLLSGVFGGDVDAGGHDVSAGDVGHFSPLSPVVIAVFIATFGGTGIILEKIGMAWHFQIPVAVAAGLAVGAVTFYLFYKLVQVTTSTNEPTMDDIIGLEAQVITPIPANGLGEIAYVAKGQRFNSPGRSLDNSEIPANALVRIVKVVSNTYYVERIS